MSEIQAGGSSIVDRAKNILISPKSEWAKIDAEPMTVGGIFTGWVLILAAIPALALLIGTQLFGINAGIMSFRISFGASLSMAVGQYISSVLGVFVLGFVIDALAPSFGGTRNQVQAMKVAAYSATAWMVAGIFMLLPPLGMIAVLIGLVYGLYLLYLGLPMLMKVGADKAVVYLVVVILAAIVIGFILNMIVGAVTGPAMGPVAMSPVS